MLPQILSTEIRETRLGELEKNSGAVGNCDLALDSSKDTASLVGRQRLYIAAQQWWHTARYQRSPQARAVWHMVT